VAQRGSKPKCVAIYTRFSSKLQKKTSTEDQIRDCREAAEKQGWIVLDEFTRSDERKSGQMLKGRAGLDELMKLAQQKDCPFDGIVIYDTSRFGRNLTDGLGMTDILKYHGIFLFFTTHDLDSRDKNFRKLFITYASQDEDYCADIADRVHRAQRGAALKGNASSGRTYGYKNIAIPSADGTRWRNGRVAVDGVRREIIPEEAAVINRIFEMYAGGLGQQAISIKLNEEGVPSTMKAYGHPASLWCTPTIANILRNTKYIGINTWNKSKVVRNPIEQRKESHKRPESEWEVIAVPEWRIVSDDLWNSVVREIANRQGRAGRKKGGLNRTEASRKYIASGLLHCLCGRTFVAFHTLRGGVRYACAGWRIGKCTNNISILLTILESQMLQAISECVRDSALRDKLASEYCEQMVSHWNECEAQTQKITATGDDLRERRQNLLKKVDNIVDALQDDGRNPHLTKRLKGIEKELVAIDEDLQTASQVVTPPLSEDQAKELVTRKLAAIDAALKQPPEVVKQILARHIDTLLMKPVETPEGLRYEMTGEIRLFAAGDPDHVLLEGSLKRTCKQYTPLSFPLRASLITRAEEWGRKGGGPPRPVYRSKAEVPRVPELAA